MSSNRIHGKKPFPFESDVALSAAAGRPMHKFPCRSARRKRKKMAHILPTKALSWSETLLGELDPFVGPCESCGVRPIEVCLEPIGVAERYLCWRCLVKIGCAKPSPAEIARRRLKPSFSIQCNTMLLKPPFVLPIPMRKVSLPPGRAFRGYRPYVF